MRLEAGLVLMADTRTNAGVDNFSMYRKLHVLSEGPGRQVYAATAGSLSLSQSAMGMLTETTGQGAGIEQAQSMFAVAQVIGEAVAHVGETTGAALAREHIDNSLELLVGGRIGDGPLKLFLVECTSEVPFLQIGETKYGRPILDRALTYETPLAAAVKIGLLSFDSTMESNLGVAHPIDVLVLPASPEQPALKRRIDEDDSYFGDITSRWARMLNDGVSSLPDPPWLSADT